MKILDRIRRRYNLGRCWFDNQVLAPLQYYEAVPQVERPCPIDWQPTALEPVFYGFRDYGSVDGAPGPCRVFFPSIDGSPQNAEILEGCGTYPLILFAHGQCIMEVDHYKKWFVLPATLARAGYVVVVPQIPQADVPLQNTKGLTLIGKTIEWVRKCWRHRDVVHPSTGIAGHSYGGKLAARYTAQNDISAYASISGSSGTGGKVEPPRDPDIATYFCWGEGESTLESASAISQQEWDTIPKPKHRAIFEDAYHWDYLPPNQTVCEGNRGDCGVTHWINNDLVTLFFARYLTGNNPSPNSDIPPSLVPPSLELTPQQEFYAGGHLQSTSLIENDPDCRVALTWDVDTESGTTTMPTN